MAKISLLRNLKPLTILHRAPTHMHWRAPDSTIGKFKSNKRTESKFLGLCLVVVLPFLTVRQDDKESEEGRETPEGAEGRVPSRWYFLVPPPGMCVWVWDFIASCHCHSKWGLPFHLRFQCQSLERHQPSNLEHPVLPSHSSFQGAEFKLRFGKMSRAECALLTVSVHSKLTLNIPPTSAHMATLTRTPNKTFSSKTARTKSNIRGKSGKWQRRRLVYFIFLFSMFLMYSLCRRNSHLNTPKQTQKFEFSC